MPIPHLYSNLARQGLAKSITHGYAQSVVAATHPQAYANHNRTSRFGLNRCPSKVGTRQYLFQNAFHSSTQSTSTIVQEGRPEKSDGGLDAYFEAWKKHHAAGEPEKEWTQFQFPKLIEWKPSSINADGEISSKLEAPKPVERAHSASTVDDIKKTEFVAAEEAALAKIDAAIEKEIQSRNEQAIFEAELSIVAARLPTPPIDRTASPAASVSESSYKTPTSSFSSLTSASDLQSQSYAEHLTKCSSTGRYAEIPAVFEAMLVAGINPTAAAYNALLDAAIHLPAERIQVVPKALDVYSDMLRRKVLPNTATYNTLINLLSTRSIEVSSLKRSLEEKRVRFGGMEEPGKFMFPSNEFEFAILAEDDRLDLAIRLFDASIIYRTDRAYPPETYHRLIQACSAAGRVPEMIRLYDHMELNNIVPLAATFPPMIKGFTQTGDLSSAVECYNEYKQLAVSHDNGDIELKDRQDGLVYAAVVKAYITSDRIEGANKFYKKILESYGASTVTVKDSIIDQGFVSGLLERGLLMEALHWAEGLGSSTKANAMSQVATAAADKDNKLIAVTAFANVPSTHHGVAAPAMAMLALSVRAGDVAAAQRYWHILSHPEMLVSSSFIEPATMYAVAMIGSGEVNEGLSQSEQMFARIRLTAADSNAHMNDEIEEGLELIHRFMNLRSIADHREIAPEAPIFQQSFTPVPVPHTAPPTYEDTFDPYSASTDFKGSALIADELERGNSGRAKVSRLNEALGRFRNMRRAGRHPRYITYAKLISAAAREERINLIHDILGMARSDIPPLPQYSVVRYGWVSILDAMVGACLTLGNRTLAAQYHQELLDMGASPTANTFGLYITTLKESTKTFDEATEAVKIFHRAKSEGVEPSSFLYNALIGKLGKARRIDDCLFYFAEMRSLGIRPTSVTYGTIVNALCRVSDEKFAEELFEEMESMPNYKARPAPYNSLMQFFLTTKRDKAKVLAYYERMKSKGIQPTNHTYKLLVDSHATLEPVNMEAAEAVLDVIRSTGQNPEAVHYSSLIHAKGCVMHDMEGARSVFNSVMADSSIRPQACLYQALFESMVANHKVADTEPVLREMALRGVDMTPYIANTLIHGWANEMNINKSKSIFASVGRGKREPSTYEAMTRAYLAVEDRQSAQGVVQEMLSRGYPGAVSNKILELLGGGNAENNA
ncbi:putative pentatricopeptide repeat-containing protein [Amylocarpus encephaloides]|uniref:Pentatricopeptide repeat-containing protein n=1 Tax=Amylocarpus encephaloides TaxID=45428 RepID=A0A9P8C6K7_9HELO|nr:putative pentatricopeptide repeat-containing protein [Amylocarpus encephaloides]